MLADDGSLSASYGQDAITDQTNTDTERRGLHGGLPDGRRDPRSVPAAHVSNAVGHRHRARDRPSHGKDTCQKHLQEARVTNRAEAVNLAERAGLLPHR